MLGIRALGCRCPAWQGWWAPRTSDPGTGAARFMTAGSNPVDFQRWLFYAASFGLLWGLFSAFALGRSAGGAFISARLGAASSRPSLFDATDVAWGGVPVNAQERNLPHRAYVRAGWQCLSSRWKMTDGGWRCCRRWRAPCRITMAHATWRV